MKSNIVWGEGGRIVDLSGEIGRKYSKMAKCLNTFVAHCSLLEPYWGILTLGRFCTELASLRPYCHDLGPIFPSTVRLALG